ncbi:hypothetical protein GEV33_014323 [Tenebrio molitor]|uniref:Protein tweety homolog n=1 Tax=Tenebrio molitor TaxID=7067 RepID=A0A8J6H5I0_TENMO|nr:hypothetical protein GEV33_014323 [Tenebrio molitor]
MRPDSVLSVRVALGDLCIAPDKFIEDQASTELSKEILRYYTSCERARANPFTQRLREAKTTIENMRLNLNSLKQPAMELFPKKSLETKFSSLKNEVNSADTTITILTTAVDCRALHAHYLRGARALCNVGLLGLTLMLLSAVLAGLLLTALVWVDSHTWIYIRKRKEYHQVNENDPYLPPPQASQAIAARTLQRSQGSSYPPDTPPPSYTSALMHNRTHASAPFPHEADSLLGRQWRSERTPNRLPSQMCAMQHVIVTEMGVTCDRRSTTEGRPICLISGATLSAASHPTTTNPLSQDLIMESKQTIDERKLRRETDRVCRRAACKEFPNFIGFKFDQQRQPAPEATQQRTANIQKFSSLGRRPLPQTPDEKARKQPAVPKVPATISQTVETPLNPANFRSLQRGAWQDNTTTTFQPGVQFRSLQRGATAQPNHSQFRSAKIQDQAHSEAVYANSESERSESPIDQGFFGFVWSFLSCERRGPNEDGTFLVSITGQIEYVDILAPSGTSWHCKYEFVTGADWKIIGGLEAGLSQTSNVVVNGDKVVLNFPLEINFKSTNIYGWPQIVLSVYKGMQLEGYGRVHMPLRPGVHKLDVSLAKPVGSSLLGYVGSFFGYQPELLQPKMLATTAGNHLIQTVSYGEVRISANVVMQGIRNLGYDLGRGKD